MCFFVVGNTGVAVLVLFGVWVLFAFAWLWNFVCFVGALGFDFCLCIGRFGSWLLCVCFVFGFGVSVICCLVFGVVFLGFGLDYLCLED